MIANTKKEEFWIYFTNPKNSIPPTHLTPKKLKKLKEDVFNDVYFWEDIMLRHGGAKHTISELKQSNKELYEHLEGNFWGLLSELSLRKK